VGHETDFTLADLAADHRAPTPTAAAQMALPDRGEAAGKVSELVRRARRADAWRRDSLRRELRAVSGTLLDPRPLLHARRFAVAEATNALVERLRETIRNGRVDTTRLLAAVRTHSPEAWLARRRGDLDVLRERAVRPLLSCQAERSAALSLARGKLAALDPKAVLTRGYAIVVSEADGRAIRSVTEVAPDDPLRVQVADGEFRVVARERP
jgi:exodeoxyribonuclease VII large subunit